MGLVRQETCKAQCKSKHNHLNCRSWHKFYESHHHIPSSERSYLLHINLLVTGLKYAALSFFVDKSYGDGDEDDGDDDDSAIVVITHCYLLWISLA